MMFSLDCTVQDCFFTFTWVIFCISIFNIKYDRCFRMQLMYWTLLLCLNGFTRKRMDTAWIQLGRPSSFVTKLPSTEHRAQRTDHRAQSTEHRVQSTEYRVQSTEYRVQSTEYRVQNTEYREQGTEYLVTSTEYRVSRTENGERRTENGVQ